MSKVKKAKEHKFLNKHTVLGVFLLMYFNFVLIDFVLELLLRLFVSMPA